MAGFTFSAETRAKMSASRKGKPLPAALLRQQVSKYPPDVNGTRVCIACSKTLPVQAFCKGKKFCCKLCFNSSRPSRKTGRKNSILKPVEMHNGTLSVTWLSVAAASAFAKVDRHLIKIAADRKKLYKGFFWRYV
jgi:hypothetical protein